MAAFFIGRLFHTLPELFQAHKIISFFSGDTSRISKEFADLYEKGLSLRDIAKQTGKAKNTVRDALLRSGIPLRSNVATSTVERVRSSGKSNIRPYYGFCYFQGKLVSDQREYENFLLIHRLWKLDNNPNRIADTLNEKRIPPRSASAWSRNSIVNIIKRFEQELIVIEGTNYELK